MKKKLLKKELDEYKKMILQKKEALSDAIDHISEDTKKSQKDASGDISGYSFHMADVATDNYDREFSLGIVSNERKQVYDLNDALKRIEEGSYGICQECKGFIPKARLKAVLHARLCVKCQEKKDKH